MDLHRCNKVTMVTMAGLLRREVSAACLVHRLRIRAATEARWAAMVGRLFTKVSMGMAITGIMAVMATMATINNMVLVNGREATSTKYGILALVSRRLSMYSLGMHLWMVLRTYKLGFRRWDRDGLLDTRKALSVIPNSRIFREKLEREGSTASGIASI